MPPRYFLRLLGDPELFGPDGETIRLRVRKHLALLAYFAASRKHIHRRDRLADFLWPEASPAEGRHSVAVALSALRGKLGPRTFECSRDTVRFVAPNLDVDLERLAQGQILDDALPTALEVDAFLGGFEVSRAPEFMVWRDQMRAKWLPLIQSALVALMDRCRRTGDFARIESHADRLLGLDEYSEQAIRAKIEARAFAGDRVSAIRIYEDWRTRLQTDLDAAPSVDLERMALRLRRRGLDAPGAAHVPVVLTEQWRDRAFIGRASQYRVLYENWERTRDARARHGLLLGESGIGKSTLAQRLTTAAALEGAVTSRVQCYDVEREIPYAAVGTLVRGLLEQPGAGGTPPEWLSELSRTVAAVRERFPHLPVPGAVDGETVRIRLAEAVQQLAVAVAEEHPVILVVDDVHIADDASVAVLHLLMRHTRTQRVMVLMTARGEELRHSPHASRLVESREPLGLEVVEVPPFTPDEMHELVTALGAAAGDAVPTPLRRALVQAAAGIPMVAELLFDDWRRRGSECLALSLGAMTSDFPRLAAEQVYQQLFRRVFDSLSPEAQAVLNLAAILGERLNQHEMYELVDLTTGQRLAGMLELTRERVLIDTGNELQFRNELVRGCAYGSVPSPLRRTLHGLVADRLLREREKGSAVPGLTLAWHCFRGGRGADAVPHLLDGAREAINHGAPHAAELALSSAAASLAPGPGAEAVLLLAEALQEQGRWEESIVVLEGHEHPEPDWRQRREIQALRAHAILPRSEVEARETLSRLRAFAAKGVPPSMESIVLEGAERAVSYLHDIDAANELINWSHGLIEADAGLQDRIRSAISLTILAWITRTPPTALDLPQSLDALTREAAEAGFLCSAMGRLHSAQGTLLASVGDYSGAIHHYTAARIVYRRIYNVLVEALTDDNLALCHGRLGNYNEQLLWAKKAGENLPNSVDPWTRIKVAYRAAWAAAMMGKAREAEELLHSVLGIREDESRSWARQAEGICRADILQVLGETKLALGAAAETLEATGLDPISRAYAGPVARWVARLGIEDGRRSDSEEMLWRQMRQASEYDLIDQLEIVAAYLWYTRQIGHTWDEGVPRVKALLAQLPPAVGSQIQRVGFTI